MYSSFDSKRELVLNVSAQNRLESRKEALVTKCDSKEVEKLSSADDFHVIAAVQGGLEEAHEGVEATAKVIY